MIVAAVAEQKEVIELLRDKYQQQVPTPEEVMKAVS